MFFKDLDFIVYYIKYRKDKKYIYWQKKFNLNINKLDLKNMSLIIILIILIMIYKD